MRTKRALAVQLRREAERICELSAQRSPHIVLKLRLLWDLDMIYNEVVGWNDSRSRDYDDAVIMSLLFAAEILDAERRK